MTTFRYRLKDVNITDAIVAGEYKMGNRVGDITSTIPIPELDDLVSNSGPLERYIDGGLDTKTVYDLIQEHKALIGQLRVVHADAAGNIVANVTPRHGLEADLLLVAGGDGELASATDTRGIVLYSGTPGVGHLARGSEVVSAFRNPSFTDIILAAPNVEKIIQVTSGGMQYFSTGTGKFTQVPVTGELRILANPKPFAVGFEAFISFAPATATDKGTYRELAIQIQRTVSNPGVWETAVSSRIPAVEGGVQSVHLKMDALMWAFDTSEAMLVRLMAKHDCTAVNYSTVAYGSGNSWFSVDLVNILDIQQDIVWVSL